MARIYDRELFDATISQLKFAAFNFAYVYIDDKKAKKAYISQTRALSHNFCAKVAAGELSAFNAVLQIESIRNDILDATLLRSNDTGKAKVIRFVKTG